MSTVALLPGSPISDSPAVAQVDPGYRMLTLAERLQRSLLARCNHNYTWPQTRSNLTYPAGYNSHQTCGRCSDERFYDSQTMKPGPSFLWTNIRTK